MVLIRLIKSKTVRKWGGGWLFLQVLFAFFYYFCWDFNPSSFLINEDFNKNPIGIIQNLDWENKKTSTTHLRQKEKDIVISDLERRFATSINKLNSKREEQKSFRKELDKLILEIQEVYKQNDIINQNKEDKGNIVKLRKEVEERKNVILHFKYLSSTREWNSRLRNEKVELVNSQFKLSKEILKVLENKINRVKEDYPTYSELLKQIDSLNKKLNKLKNKQLVLSDDIKKLESNRDNLNEKLYKEYRKQKLNIFDFFYFSIITATTTGYGDIAPNNRIIRLGVVVQIIFSLIIFALFLEVFIEKAKRDEKSNIP